VIDFLIPPRRFVAAPLSPDNPCRARPGLNGEIWRHALADFLQINRPFESPVC